MLQSGRFSIQFSFIVFCFFHVLFYLISFPHLRPLRPVFDDRQVGGDEVFAHFQRGFLRQLGLDDALVLPLEYVVGPAAKPGDALVDSPHPSDAVIKSQHDDAVFLVHGDEIRQDLDLVADVIQPQVRESFHISNRSFKEDFSSYLNTLDSGILLVIKVETQHIACGKVKVVQIILDLLLAVCVISWPAPYL